MTRFLRYHSVEIIMKQENSILKCEMCQISKFVPKSVQKSFFYNFHLSNASYALDFRIYPSYPGCFASVKLGNCRLFFCKSTSSPYPIAVKRNLGQYPYSRKNRQRRFLAMVDSSACGSSREGSYPSFQTFLAQERKKLMGRELGTKMPLTVDTLVVAPT